jgi:hypothetical protein
MEKPLTASLACLAVCGLMLGAGCSEPVSSSVGACEITTTVVFHVAELEGASSGTAVIGPAPHRC